MHICVLTRSTVFHDKYGGMEHITHELGEQLAKKGHKVTLITTSLKERQYELIVKNDFGYRLVSIPDTKPMKYSKSWWKNSIIYFEYFHLNDPFDVVLSVSAAGFSLVTHKNKYQIPFVFQAHGTSIGEIKTKIQLNWKKKLSALKNMLGYIKDLKYLPKFDFIIAVGEKTYNDLLNSKVKMNDNIILINNAINDSFKRDDNARLKLRAELKLSEDAKVIISTSRLHPEKGIAQSLKIFHLLQEKFNNLYYIVIGDGPQKEDLVRLSHNMGISEKVIFTGRIDRKELHKYYSSADFLLFPTLREEVGLPLTVLEALACSLVCFVSEGLITSAKIPIIPIPPKNIEQSVKIIEKYLLSSDLEKRRADGVKFIKDHFSVSSWVTNYENAFQKYIKRNKKGV